MNLIVFGYLYNNTKCTEYICTKKSHSFIREGGVRRDLKEKEHLFLNT